MISGDVSVSRERTFREIPRWIWEMKWPVISKAALEAKEKAEFRGKVFLALQGRPPLIPKGLV